MILKNGDKGQNDWWRYLAGILLVLTGYFIGQLPLYGVVYYQFSQNNQLDTSTLANFESSLNFDLIGVNRNFGFVLMIMMFVVAMLALIMAIRYLHQKRVTDMITVKSKIDFRKILFAFGFWGVLTVIMEVISYSISPEVYTFRWEAGSFFILVVISLVLLPIQTSFEELFIRGYIMQGIAFFSRHKGVAILLSSIFFGLLHGTNPEVEKFGFWTMQFYYILAGLFLAVITVLDDGLELALGIHAAINVLGATFVSYEGSVLQTDSLFISSEIKPWLMILSFILAAGVFMAICYKKYDWPKLSTLLDSIDENKVDTLT